MVSREEKPMPKLVNVYISPIKGIRDASNGNKTVHVHHPMIAKNERQRRESSVDL